jgi:hypothetical protein
MALIIQKVVSDSTRGLFIHMVLFVDFSVVVMANVLVGCNFMFSH